MDILMHISCYLLHHSLSCGWSNCLRMLMAELGALLDLLAYLGIVVSSGYRRGLIKIGRSCLIDIWLHQVPVHSFLLASFLVL